MARETPGEEKMSVERGFYQRVGERFSSKSDIPRPKKLKKSPSNKSRVTRHLSIQGGLPGSLFQRRKTTRGGIDRAIAHGTKPHRSLMPHVFIARYR